MTGLYDVTLAFAADEDTPGLPAPRRAEGTALPDGVSIRTAVAQKLGLNLKAGRGPVEVIVVDQLEKPSEN